MELKIVIKDEHEEFLRQIENEFSVDGIEKTLQVLVKEILNKFEQKIVFEEIRCVGGCFSNDKFLNVKFDEDQIILMKDIYKNYEFEEYDSEEEELSKVIRCIINYADQECDINKIFI